MTKTSQLYVLLFTLYWAQGLPVGFMTQALPVILRAEGLSLTHIGGFGLLMLPWSIKILWAPFVDRYGSSRWGHYRSWILPTQLLTVMVLVGLSFIPIHALNEPKYLLAFFIGLLCMNTLGATQDMGTDGLAVNLLQTQQQSWGNSFQVIGSRLGFIVGGGAMLWALDWLEWQMTFLCLAALVLINTLPIWRFKEPVQTRAVLQPHPEHKSLPMWTQIARYFQYFRSTPVLLAWLGVLLSFKIADGLSGPILKPLLVDLGLNYQQIGIYITMYGAIAALVGAALAALLLKKLTRGRTLMIFSAFKALALGAFTVLASQYEQGQTVAPWMIYLINAFEDMVSAMLLVVMLTLIMGYSRKNYAATDFTFQVALMATVSGGLYIMSGMIGDWLGYLNYLAFITLIAVLTIFPMMYWCWLNNKYKQGVK